MATPYIAGCVALLLQSDRSLKFNEVRYLLQNNAVPKKRYNSDLIDSVVNQGAGLVNIYNAITAKTFVTPSEFALNDTIRTQPSYTLSITNDYKVSVKYTVSSLGAAQANAFVKGDDIIQPQSTTTYTASYATVKFRGLTTLTLTVPAGKTVDIETKFLPPASADPTLFPIFSGYITVSSDHDDRIIRVPYAGMVGDWKTAPIFSRNSPVYQSILSPLTSGTAAYLYSETFIGPVPANYVYNVTDARTNPIGDVIIPLTLIATTSRVGAVDLIYTGSDTTVLNKLSALGLSGPTQGNYLAGEPFQRNTPITSGQSILFPAINYWYGQVTKNATTTALLQLPAGQYKFRFSALKHFGKVGSDPNGPNYDRHHTTKEEMQYHDHHHHPSSSSDQNADAVVVAVDIAATAAADGTINTTVTSTNSNTTTITGIEASHILFTFFYFRE
ncbi:hypothetical protein HDU76_007256 [Blyttiomyces sp. JEL0837]|nr:hypothetical protein HDU76_007256 [Blyttiomyces sp. JEL0837]